MINSPIKNINKETRKLIRRWVSNNIETLTVGKVVNVSEYSSNRLVDVLPLPIDTQSDGHARVPSVVYRCPVILEGNLDGYLSYPAKLGDKVLLGYCKQSIAEFVFSQKAEQYFPEDLSLFGANDAVVLGFIGQAGRDKSVSATNFELNYQDSYLRITPDDDITLNNPIGSVNIAPSGTIESTNGSSTLTLNISGDITADNGSGSVNIAPDGTITSDSGAASVEVNSSGNVTIQNGTSTISIAAGVITLTAPAGVSVNGAQITPTGNMITASGSNLDDIYQVYNTHTHGENDNVGTTETDPPTQQI